MVAQWKRKTQKVTGELNDTKLLLEEQTSRNTLLEKKQRKYDDQLGMLNEDKKQESNQREKLQREVDALKTQKYGLEEQIHVSTHFLQWRHTEFCFGGANYTLEGGGAKHTFCQIFGAILVVLLKEIPNIGVTPLISYF